MVITPDLGSTWRCACRKAPWSNNRCRVATCFVRGKLIALLGRSTETFRSWESTDRGRTWQQLPAAGFPAKLREFTLCVNRDGAVFALGGMEEHNYRADVWRSDDTGSSWRCIGAGKPWRARRDAAAVCSAGGELVLAGGNCDCYQANDVWVSRDEGESWTCACASAPWRPRSGHRMLATASGAIVLMSDAGYSNDVWRSLDVGRTWSCVWAAAPWPPSWHLEASMVGKGRADSRLALNSEAARARRPCHGDQQRTHVALNGRWGVVGGAADDSAARGRSAWPRG